MQIVTLGPFKLNVWLAAYRIWLAAASQDKLPDNCKMGNCNARLSFVPTLNVHIIDA